MSSEPHSPVQIAAQIAAQSATRIAAQPGRHVAPAAHGGLFKSDLKTLTLLGRGKVRENYAIDDQRMLIVTTDRISAFDVIMAEAIPNKGKILNQMAMFWFAKLADVVPNHLTGESPESVVGTADVAQVIGRSMVVKRLQPLPIEAVVRGYLIGSGWKDYQASGAVCGITLPPGLQQAEQLPEPIFTPASKAAPGEHDENITFADVVALIGNDMADRVRTISLQLYRQAREFAQTRGIIIADTKFEFGLDAAGELHLMDEILTADSSRFWPASSYQIGTSPPSYDKQYLRDYLETLSDWDKQEPAPALPPEVVEQTARKYHEALQILTGSGLQE